MGATGSDDLLGAWERYRAMPAVETRGRTIGEADVVNFAGVTGDFAPLHVDETFAAQTAFGSRIAHGLLTLCVVTALASAARPFPGLASYGYDQIRFPSVVYLGDTIRASIRFGDMTLRDSETAVVACHYSGRNQREQLVLVAQHRILVDCAVIRELVESA